MALSRYGGITGTKKISEDFENINVAFNNVAAENDGLISDINKNKQDLENHENSNSAHPAQNIPYSGDVLGARDVKQALDNLKQELNDLILGGDDSDPNTRAEVIAARGGHVTLGDRLDATDALLAEMANKGELVFNIKDYGAVGDGVSDDTAAFQDALDDAAISGGGIVFVPSGEFGVSTINLPLVPIILKGAGHGSVITGGSETLINVSGYWSNSKGLLILEDLTIKATGTNKCLDINWDYRAWPIPSVQLNRLKFVGNTGMLVKLTHVRESFITKCVFQGGGVDTDTAQLLLVDTINMNISDSLFFRGLVDEPGGRGLWIDDTQGSNPCEGLTVSNCTFIDLKVGIEINDVLDFNINNCMIDQIIKPLIIKNTDSGRIEGNYIASRDNTVNAVAVHILNDVKSTEDIRIINNRITMDHGVGTCLKMEARGSYHINECQIAFNRIINFSVWGIELTRVANTRIAFNNIDGVTGGTSIKEISGTNNNLFAFNRVNKGISLVNATTIGNNGYKTKNYGAATIPSGQTVVTVSHGIVSTPNKITVTPTNSQIAGRQFYVVNRTGTTFQIAVNNAPSADLTFDWEAEWNGNV